MKYKVAQIPSVGMMVIEDENGILLSPAEVAGLLNSLEQRLAEAEKKISEWEAAPDWIKAGDGTLHGAIDYWQDRADRAEARLNLLLCRVGVDRFGEVFETASGNKEESKHYIDEAIRYIRGIEGS